MQPVLWVRQGRVDRFQWHATLAQHVHMGRWLLVSVICYHLRAFTSSIPKCVGLCLAHALRAAKPQIVEQFPLQKGKVFVVGAHVADVGSEPSWSATPSYVSLCYNGPVVRQTWMGSGARLLCLNFKRFVTPFGHTLRAQCTDHVNPMTSVALRRRGPTIVRNQRQRLWGE